MRQQCALHVGVRERDPCLAQVLGDRADDRDLTAGEGARQHQSVEAIVLEVAAPDAKEGVLEVVADLVDVVGRNVQAEVVDPGRLGALGGDLVGPLVDDLRAHVLERGKHVGQRHPSRAEQLAANDAGLGFERSVEAQDRLSSSDRLELLDAADVDDRRAGHPVGPVGGRECPLVAPEHPRALLLPVILDEGRPQVVGPGARRLHEPRLDLGHVVLLGDPVGRMDDVADAHEQRLGELQRPVEVGPAELVDQDPPHPLPVLGVEAIAWDADQALDKAIELVAADEQPYALTLAQAQEPHRDREQIVRVHLEQRLTGIGLDDLGERLGVVAVRRKARPLEDAVELAAQDRDLPHPLLVGRCRVQAEEAALADDRTAGIESLDPDVVQVRRSVDGGTRVGLGQDEHVRHRRQRERLRAELLVGGDG